MWIHIEEQIMTQSEERRLAWEEVKGVIPAAGVILLFGLATEKYSHWLEVLAKILGFFVGFFGWPFVARLKSSALSLLFVVVLVGALFVAFIAVDLSFKAGWGVNAFTGMLFGVGIRAIRDDFRTRLKRIRRAVYDGEEEPK
jgi:hypothetical protein